MRKIITCPICNKEKPHSAKGKCNACYKRTRYHNEPKYREKLKIYQKRYMEKNKEKWLAYHKKYQKEYYTKEKYEKTRKETNARKLYEQMDKLNFSTKTQKAIMLDGIQLEQREKELKKEFKRGKQNDK